MKSIIAALFGCMLVASVWAQNSGSTVTINVTGARNRQVSVDGVIYTLTQDINNVNGSNTPVVISNLQPGQHTIQVVRGNRVNDYSSTNRGNDYTTTFNLRYGYDMTITVNNDGTMQQSESRLRNEGRGNDRRFGTAMSDMSFNRLLRSVRSQWFNASKMNLVKTSFSNPNYYFSSDQASQLIQQANSQSGRLELAELAYPRVTDPENFGQVSGLIFSQSRKRELDSYIASYEASNHRNRHDDGYRNNNENGNSNGNGYNNGNRNDRRAMSTTQYNALYSEAQQQWPANQRMTYISNAFTSQNNYFTCTQASTMIQLVPDENSRLFLAKSSYRGITDPENFSQVVALMSTQAARNELIIYAGSYGNGNGIGPELRHAAMSGPDFDRLYHNAESQWLPLAKMTALTDAFGNVDNYFTTDQAKQLISLVSAEDNRLQLAKSAYNNVVDRENFARIYDLFYSQTSKDDLAAYINSYAGTRRY